jgi:hypothetical protein
MARTIEQTKAHATFSASGAHRWLACPGSIALSEKAPPSRDSVYSIEGTDCHTCLEEILKNPSRRLVTESRLLKKYPKEMVEDAAKVADIILKRQELSGGELICEQKVDAGPFTRPGEFGTLDAAIVQLFGTLEVIDLKYGFQVVEPEENPQMIYYALAVAYEYEFNFETVRLTIIQPRASHEDGITRSHDMTMEELAEWAITFKEGVDRALKKDALLKSGTHCKYCPAITICPKVSGEALAECKVAFSPVLDSLEVPEAKGLDADTIATILKHADAIEHWLGEVRAVAYTKIDNGGKVPGWKLVPKRANRKWLNAEKTEAEAKKTFGDIAFNRALKSPAQLEELAADAKPWVAKRCAAVSSGFTLAPEDDKRDGKKDLSIEFKPVKGGDDMATKKKAAKKTTKKKSAKKK